MTTVGNKGASIAALVPNKRSRRLLQSSLWWQPFIGSICLLVCLSIILVAFIGTEGFRLQSPSTVGNTTLSHLRAAAFPENPFPMPPSVSASASTFSLLVTLKFSSTEYKDQFLQDIQPVADHCRKNEPDTLAYEVLLSDQDPLQVLVLERYRDKEVAYLQVHKSSAPFLTFRPKLQAMQEGGHVQISGHSYLDAGVGYTGRREKVGQTA